MSGGMEKGEGVESYASEAASVFATFAWSRTSSRLGSPCDPREWSHQAWVVGVAGWAGQGDTRDGGSCDEGAESIVVAV